MKTKFSGKQTESILKLPGAERYAHFIKRVCDSEEAWGLFDDGWALAETDRGQKVLPLWPASEYAALCATGDWARFQPRAIPLKDLLDEVLPSLEEKEVLPDIFFTPQSWGVTPDTALLRTDLERELTRYQ